MINYVLVVYGLAISLLGIGQPEVRCVDNKPLKYTVNFRRPVEIVFPFWLISFWVLFSSLPILLKCN